MDAMTQQNNRCLDTALWNPRIENYYRVIGRPCFLHYEHGWIHGIWRMGNSYGAKPASEKYYGSYPGDYLRRFAALMFDRLDNVLHLFSGKVDCRPMPGKTLDINPDLCPDYCVDVMDPVAMEKVPIEDFTLIMADPPYNEKAAQNYGVKLLNRNTVVQYLAQGMQPGAYLVWLDTTLPTVRKSLLVEEALIGIVVSCNHVFRVATIYRKI
jgi:hypothetical protein